jgi:uncharacterized protein YheU (UPF0270 family)
MLLFTESAHADCVRTMLRGVACFSRKVLMTDERRVDVPIEALSPEALLGVVDDYVLREGTEYGSADVSLERKREQVMKQLQAGEAIIVFDEATETCTIARRAGLPDE